MRLLLTVKDVGDRSFDLDSAAIVGDLVDAVSTRADQTFLILRTGVRLLRSEKVIYSDIRSADVVEVVRATGVAEKRPDDAQSAATLRVVAGPNTGAEYPLRFGVNTIGRGDRNDVVLEDTLASRNHAQVHVADIITIADAGSTNGVLLGHDPIAQPTTLHDGDNALIGDSWIEVIHHNRTLDLSDIDGNTIDFNRPPRISQPYKGKDVKLPVPPNEPRKQRLPMAAFVAPLLMAALFFGIFRIGQSSSANDAIEDCVPDAETALSGAEAVLTDARRARGIIETDIDLAVEGASLDEEFANAQQEAEATDEGTTEREGAIARLEEVEAHQEANQDVVAAMAELDAKTDGVDARAVGRELTEREDLAVQMCLEGAERSASAGFAQWTSLIFLGMSPLIIVGSSIERRRSGRKEFEQERDEFRDLLGQRMLELDEEIEHEYKSRRIEAPRADEIPGFVADLSPRLWERGPDDPDVLTVRLGRADQRSRINVEVPDGGSKELRKEIVDTPDQYETVKDVPVLVDLVEAGGIGIAGLPSDSVPIALSVVSQLAGMHSPSELLIACMIGEDARPNWAWMKWLPHVNVENSPLGGPHLASTLDACHNLLGRIDQLIGERLGAMQNSSAEQHRLVMPAVAVLIDESMMIERHRLSRLLEQGPRVGVFFIWVASARRELPRQVGAYLDIPRSGPPAVGYTTSDDVLEPVAVEPIDIRIAATVARSLSPVRDVSGRFASSAQVPTRVGLVDILDGPQMLVEPTLVLQRWAQESRSLRAPVGSMAGATFSLDVRHDGPHTLVAGTTGAGKSELLQSWIASLALSYGPEKVTFLLVDYKGGSAFKDINHLPHTVGMVTDLDKNGVRRALVSLNAELHHRERILAAANCSDLAEMEKKKSPGAPPSLLIVVDEFAALVQEVPEFVEGMVNVAQRGRSLGLHLILATQRPGGVITPQVRANTNLRIALRMADESESSDVVNSPIAADIERSIPGRGVARIGPKELITFQSAYVGGVTDPDGTVETVQLGNFTMDGIERINVEKSQTNEMAATDLERLVDVVNKAHAASGAPLPRKPWLNPLGEVYELAMLPRPTSDLEVVVGAVDEPEAQEQIPMLWRPDDDGSIALVGESGSGKTVALSSLVASVAFSGSDPIPTVYALDFAGRGLLRIEDLPHVSAVVLDDDEERIRRLLGDLEKTLNERAQKFAAARAGSLPEYRSFAGEQLNRQFLFIDGLSSFFAAHDHAGLGKLTQIVHRLVRDGRQFGMHVVASTTRRQDVGTAFSRAFSRWIILRQGSIDDYRNMEVATDVLDENSPPGRAMVGRSEAQIAVLGGSAFGDVQFAALEAFGRQLRERGVLDAPPVRILPHVVSSKDVASSSWYVDEDSLEPRPLPSGLDVLQIAGPRGSGRSVAMWRAAANSDQTYDSIDLFTSKPAALPTPPEWRVWQPSTDGAGTRLQELVDSSDRRLVLFDDFGPLSDSQLGMKLEELIRLARTPGLSIILTIENVDGRSSFKPVIREVRSYRSSLLLRPDPMMDGEIAGTELPRMKTHNWPPGRGFLVLDNAMQLVQVVNI